MMVHSFAYNGIESVNGNVVELFMFYLYMLYLECNYCHRVWVFSPKIKDIFKYGFTELIILIYDRCLLIDTSKLVLKYKFRIQFLKLYLLSSKLITSLK